MKINDVMYIELQRPWSQQLLGHLSKSTCVDISFDELRKTYSSDDVACTITMRRLLTSILRRAPNRTFSSAGLTS